jgi:hypothetical protein
MPAMEGNTGINGLIAPVDLDPGDIIRHYDMAASFRGEASKGRFGIMGEFLYTSLSDGIGTKTVVKKIDLQVDQMMAELALRWRIIDNPRGSLDLYGGVRDAGECGAHRRSKHCARGCGQRTVAQRVGESRPPRFDRRPTAHTHRRH